jgi:hypothetical protein
MASNRNHAWLPFQAAGTATVRRYQPIFWPLASRMPDSELCQQKGTLIFWVPKLLPASHQCSLTPASPGSKRKSQAPFKFSQLARWKSGRGCSGRGTGCAKSGAGASQQNTASRGIKVKVLEGIVTLVSQNN